MGAGSSTPAVKLLDPCHWKVAYGVEPPVGVEARFTVPPVHTGPSRVAVMLGNPVTDTTAEPVPVQPVLSVTVTV
mgnify:CR=1 FL=1